MQIRYATNLSAEQYVRQKAWHAATLNECPLHPRGGCAFRKNGTYQRKYPAGTKIARWYCAVGHMSFSLLPDCLASRLSGSLIKIEDVLTEVENSHSQEAAAENIRIDIILPSALRWIRRRIFLVKASLSMLIELLPGLFADCHPSILSFQSALNVDYALPELRQVASSYLTVLPPPLGFGPRPKTKKSKKVIFNTKQGLTRQTSDAKLVPKSIISSSYDQNAQVWLQKVYRPLGLLPVACTAAPWFRHYKNWCLKTNQKGSI